MILCEADLQHYMFHDCILLQLYVIFLIFPSLEGNLIFPELWNVFLADNGYLWANKASVMAKLCLVAPAL